MLRDIFGLHEQKEKATYGFGYILTLTRNKDEAVLDIVVGIADAKSKNDLIHWYVPRYTPSIRQQCIFSEHFLSKSPTKLRYVERSVFVKELIYQSLWNFQLSSQESIKIPIYNNIRFQ